MPTTQSPVTWATPRMEPRLLLETTFEPADSSPVGTPSTYNSAATPKPSSYNSAATTTKPADSSPAGTSSTYNTAATLKSSAYNSVATTTKPVDSPPTEILANQLPGDTQQTSLTHYSMAYRPTHRFFTHEETH